MHWSEVTKPNLKLSTTTVQSKITWSGVNRSSIRFTILISGILSIVFSTPRVTLEIICLDTLSIICNTLYKNKWKREKYWKYVQSSELISINHHRDCLNIYNVKRFYLLFHPRLKWKDRTNINSISFLVNYFNGSINLQILRPIVHQ